MADMLKINTSLSASNYSLPSKPVNQPNEVFNIVDLTKVEKTNESSIDIKHANNSSATSTNNTNINVNITKNTLSTATMLKNILGSEFTNQILTCNDPELIKEFNQFCETIYVNENSIEENLSHQHKNSTRFSGEIFDILKQLISNTNNPEIKEAAVLFLKSTFEAQTRENIIKSLASNFLFLSKEFKPSKGLSAKLEQMAKMILDCSDIKDLDSLKEDAQKLLDQTSSSLLATNKTKNMVELIKYNLKRSNQNTSQLDYFFKKFLNLIPESELKQSLENAFLKFVDSNLLPINQKKHFLNTNPDILSDEKILFKLCELSNEHLKQLNINDFTSSLDNISAQLAKLIDNTSKNPILSMNNGALMIKEILLLLIPNSKSHITNEFIDIFKKNKDLNLLVDRMSYMVNNIENSEIKIMIADILNNILTAMSYSSDLKYTHPTSQQTLFEFLNKFLGNDKINSLNLIDVSEIANNVLTVPGVFTPLIHYILPVQIGNIKSYAEIWIDNSPKKDLSENIKTHHVFITFDIEDLGIFELELFTKNQSLDVNLYCPKNLTKHFSKLKPKFELIAKSSGYQLNLSNIKSLKKQRNLLNVFPHLRERRVGLDVKI